MVAERDELGKARKRLICSKPGPEILMPLHFYCP
jgi:hypothetical protein